MEARAAEKERARQQAFERKKEEERRKAEEERKKIEKVQMLFSSSLSTAFKYNTHSKSFVFCVFPPEMILVWIRLRLIDDQKRRKIWESLNGCE